MTPPLIALIVAAGFCAFAILAYTSRSRGPGAVAVTRPGPKGDLSLATLFWVAFLARFVVGNLLLVFDWHLILAPDSEGYILLGNQLANTWHMGIGGDPEGLRSGVLNFIRLNAGIYYVFGRAPIFVVALTSLAGGLTTIMSAQIANHLAGPAAGRRVGWLVALFPSLILWSSIPLRDAFTILAVTGSAHATIRLKDVPSIGWGAALAVWLLIAGTFRGYLFLLLGVGVIAAFLASSKYGFVRNWVGALLALTVVGVLAGFVGLGEHYFEYVDLERIAELRRGMTHAAESSFMMEADISTPGRALLFLPLGLLYFLFGPFPWDVEGLRQWLTLPEMLFWYFLAFMMWRGLREIARRGVSYVWLILTVVGTISVTYALISGNLGTAYRHRAQVVPLMLVVAGIGWEARRRRWSLRVTQGVKTPKAIPSQQDAAP